MPLPCNTGWRGIHNVVQAGLELTSALLSLSLECWDYICMTQCLGQYLRPKGPVSYLWNSGNNAVSPDEHLSLGKRSHEPATPQSKQFHVPLTILSTQQSQACSLLFAAGDRDVRNTVLSAWRTGVQRRSCNQKHYPFLFAPLPLCETLIFLKACFLLIQKPRL